MKCKYQYFILGHSVIISNFFLFDKVWISYLMQLLVKVYQYFMLQYSLANIQRFQWLP